MLPFIAIYTGLFTGIFISGEFVYVSAVIGASQQHYNLWLLLPIGFIATWGSDLFFYEIGRRRGSEWFEKKRSDSPSIEKFVRMLDERQNVLLFSYRFIFGFRTILLMIIGSQKIRRDKFYMASSIASTVWVAFYCFLGMLFGKAITALLDDFKQAEFYIIGSLIATTLILGARRLWIKRKRLRAQTASGVSNK